MDKLIRTLFREQTLLSLVVLAMAGISPNIFVAAQAGIAKMSWLATWLLVPSFGVLALALAVAIARKHMGLVRRMLIGATAGMIATLGLEVVRSAGFHYGTMPGDLPRLMGVLIMDRFMDGPSSLSDFLGYAYHFWNGATFGMIFTIILGRKPTSFGVAYGFAIGVIFLMSPPVSALGIGFMGSDMPSMPITVTVSHLAYGGILGWLCRRWLRDPGWLLGESAESRFSTM